MNNLMSTECGRDVAYHEVCMAGIPQPPRCDPYRFHHLSPVDHAPKTRHSCIAACRIRWTS